VGEGAVGAEQRGMGANIAQGLRAKVGHLDSFLRINEKALRIKSRELAQHLLQSKHSGSCVETKVGHTGWELADQSGGPCKNGWSTGPGWQHCHLPRCQALGHRLGY